MRIENNIQNILKQGCFKWNQYFLPDIQLDRKDYLKVNDVLTSLWLVWNKCKNYNFKNI